MRGLHCKPLGWMAGMRNLEQRGKLLSEVVSFLLESFFWPILDAFFVTSESSGGRHELHYFAKRDFQV